MVHWWKVDLGDDEIDAVTHSLRNRHVNQGPVCAELERKLAEQLGVPHVVLTTSGSAAILLSLMAAGVKPGDEVIVPALTFIATAHAVLMLGAKLKLVDVEFDRPVLDVEQVERALSSHTTAVVPVHLNGRSCDMTGLSKLAENRGLRVIEDSAQAFCSRNRQGCLGTQSDASAFSMSIAKLITTGEGGFIATSNRATDEQLRRLRNQGVSSIADNVFDSFGFNFRFNDIQAAIGLAQLQKLPEKISAIRRLYQFYDEQLAGIHFLKIMPSNVEVGELPLCTDVLCADRDRVIGLLSKRGIQARPSHPCLADSPHLAQPGAWPRARFFAAHGLTLPSGPDQTAESIDRVVKALHEIASDISTHIDSIDPDAKTDC
jgi:dTDP-4-amino-4,6-dideoxygalactose transaminase